eukprot:2621245-Amphidinium_carterae.2
MEELTQTQLEMLSQRRMKHSRLIPCHSDMLLSLAIVHVRASLLCSAILLAKINCPRLLQLPCVQGQTLLNSPVKCDVLVAAAAIANQLSSLHLNTQTLDSGGLDMVVGPTLWTEITMYSPMALHSNARVH